MIASGGMCDIYKARQVSMDRWVALKVMRLPGSDGGPFVQWFYREMRAAARIQHPNTVRVYDFGQLDDGGFWLAMELLEGRTLEVAIAASRRFAPARTVLIARQIAKALNAAHLEGVVHRDLKGENILLLDLYGERDFVKVVDFGIASMPGVGSGQGMVAGTPEFMSPEQARGLEVDARTDLYALGVLLYQMATGRLPFEHRDPHQVMNMQVHRNPRPPSQILAEPLPDLMESLILDLLRKDPAERPASAEEVLQRLAACAAHPSVSRRTHERWEESSASILLNPDLRVVEADVLEPAGPTIVCTARQLGHPAADRLRRPGRRRAWGWAGAAVLGVAGLALPLGLPAGGAPDVVRGRGGAVALAGLSPPQLVVATRSLAAGLRDQEQEAARAGRAPVDVAGPVAADEVQGPSTSGVLPDSWAEAWPADSASGSWSDVAATRWATAAPAPLSGAAPSAPAPLSSAAPSAPAPLSSAAPSAPDLVEPPAPEASRSSVPPTVRASRGAAPSSRHTRAVRSTAVGHKSSAIASPDLAPAPSPRSPAGHVSRGSSFERWTPKVDP